MACNVTKQNKWVHRVVLGSHCALLSTFKQRKSQAKCELQPSGRLKTSVSCEVQVSKMVFICLELDTIWNTTGDNQNQLLVQFKSQL